MRQSVTLTFHFMFVLVFLLVLAATQCSWSQQPLASTAKPESVEPISPSPKAPGSVLVIGAGDLLKVSVFGAPESDQEVRVDQDGNISLNFIGAVHVAGLSTNAAQDLIAKKLSDGGFFTHPQVSVFAKEYATQGVSVLGEVQRPGVYPLLGSRRLFDVLSLAGGTSQKAGRMVSVTRRDHPESPRSVYMSNDPIESAKSNIEIFAGEFQRRVGLKQHIFP